MIYEFLFFLHILGLTVLLGTGAGITVFIAGGLPSGFRPLALFWRSLVDDHKARHQLVRRATKALS